VNTRYLCADGTSHYPNGHDTEQCLACMRAMRDGYRRACDELKDSDVAKLLERLRFMDERVRNQRKELEQMNAKFGGPTLESCHAAFDRWCMPLDRSDRRFAATCFRAGWQAARRASSLPPDDAKGGI
jgi:hypothetical protein